MSKKLCIRCLRYRNRTHSCKPKPCGINNCKYFHNILLHFDRSTEKASAEEQDPEAKEVINSAWTMKRKQSYLKIVPLQVKGPRGVMNTFALMDDGSTVTLMDEEIAKKMGATGPVDPLRIETINDLKTSAAASRRVQLKGMTDMNNKSRLERSRIYRCLHRRCPKK